MDDALAALFGWLGNPLDPVWSQPDSLTGDDTLARLERGAISKRNSDRFGGVYPLQHRAQLQILTADERCQARQRAGHLLGVDRRFKQRDTTAAEGGERSLIQLNIVDPNRLQIVSQRRFYRLFPARHNRQRLAKPLCSTQPLRFDPLMRFARFAAEGRLLQGLEACKVVP